MTSMLALFGSFFFIWSFLAWFAGGVFCSTVATAKNLNPLMWFVGGLLFPVISLIAVAGMPSKLSVHEKRLLLEKFERNERERKQSMNLSANQSATTSDKLTADDVEGWPDGLPIKRSFSIPNWVFYVGILVLVTAVFSGRMK